MMAKRALGFCLCIILLAAPRVQALPSVEKQVLANGLTLLTAREKSLPAVTVQIMIDAGAWRDPPDTPGLANLTAESLLLGTPTHSAAEIHRRFEFMGTEVSVSCGRDVMVARLRTLTEHLAESMALFTACLRRPAFPPSEVRRKAETIAGTIAAEEDQPSLVARKAFMHHLYRSGPYGHPPKGRQAALGRMTAEDVAGFHARFYRPGQTIVAVVGDVTAETVTQAIASRLKAWETGSRENSTATVRFLQKPRTVTVDRDIAQAHIRIGHGGIARNNDDFHAVTVMNHILGGGGFGSRMVQRIRVEEGLAYSVSSRFAARRYPGSFQVVLQTRNASARRAMEIVLAEMKRIRTEPVGATELETAKQYLIGSFPLQLASQSGLADFLCRAAFYGLGLDYPAQHPRLIRAVQAEDVQRAARTYLHPERVLRVIVGNLEQAGLEAGPSSQVF